jgi:hypothetical protein
MPENQMPMQNRKYTAFCEVFGAFLTSSVSAICVSFAVCVISALTALHCSFFVQRFRNKA